MLAATVDMNKLSTNMNAHFRCLFNFTFNETENK